MSRALLFGLGLWLAVGATSFGGQPAALLAGQAGGQWRLVLDSGEVLAQPEKAGQTGEPECAARASWFWSDELPPLQLEPCATTLPADAARGLDLLAIGISGGPELRHGVRVLAGPLALWDQVPERLLPSWPVPAEGEVRLPRRAGETWRVRLAGPRSGSWWHDVPPSRTAIDLHLQPVAQPLRVSTTDLDGEALAGRWELARAAAGASSEFERLALQTGRGVLEFRGLPARAQLRAIYSAPGYLPLSATGWPASLPRQVRLSRGRSLGGRLVDGDGQPVARADVWLETFAGLGLPEPLRRQSASDAAGRWQLTTVPDGPAMLVVAADGFALWRRSLQIGEDQQLGELRLEPAVAQRLQLRGRLGEPVSDARITTEAGYRTRSDEFGMAELRGLAADRPLQVEIRAAGYLPLRRNLKIAHDEVLPVQLEAAFTVTGQWLAADGSPPPDAQLSLRSGRDRDRHPVAADGRFRVGLAPDRAAELVLSSPVSRRTTVELTPGAAGEVRDLGVLRAAAGRTVVGRVVRGGDGSAIAGARIWLPRPTAADPLWAWFEGDLLQATSDSEGGFTLSGLPPGKAEIRLQAAGFAERRIEVDLTEEERRAVGEIELHVGARLRVVVGEAVGDGAVVRLDTAGRWREMDMLQAPCFGGEALLLDVPPGPALLTVLEGRRLVCEKQIVIDPATSGTAQQTTECSPFSLRVTGQVEIGGQPAGAGRLRWLPEAGGGMGVILHRSSRAGLRDDQVFGAGPPQVDVEVDPSGYFSTDQLRPGSWQVLWTSAAGEVGSAQPVRLPERDTFDLRIALPAQAVAGWVRDAHGGPAGGARVRELDRGLLAMTGDDGSFRLTGLGGDRVRLRAEKGDASSAIAEVVLGDTQPPPQLLELRPTQIEELTLRLEQGSGQPASGAFAFFEEPAGRTVVTSDGTGQVTWRPRDPTLDRYRLAVLHDGAWTLGPWLPWPAPAEQIESLTLAEDQGSLTVEVAGDDHRLVLVDEQNWDLSSLSRDLGRSLLVSHRSTFAGLPAGAYRVTVGSATRQVHLTAGMPATVRFEADSSTPF